MASDPDTIKIQRNRFLALAFASADLLLETDKDGTITFALGAALSLTSVNPDSLTGRHWLDIFAPDDRATLEQARTAAITALRVGPIDVTLDKNVCREQQALVTGLKMPDDDRFYFTISFPNALLKRLAEEIELQRTSTIPTIEPGEFDRTQALPDDPAGEFDRTETIPEEESGEFDRTEKKKETIATFDRTETKADEDISDFGRTATKDDDKALASQLDQAYAPDESSKEQDSTENTDLPLADFLNKNHFISATEDALKELRLSGTPLAMTLVEIPESFALKKQLGPEKYESFAAAFHQTLMSYAWHRHVAAMINEQRYIVLHPASTTTESIDQAIIALLSEHTPENTETPPTITKAVSIDLTDLNQREVTKPLLYIVSDFERNGMAMTIEALDAHFQTYAQNNTEKKEHLRTMIERLDFDFHYHPVIDLSTLELSYYEIITNFRDERSTHEWVLFGEDVGMAADFDIAVCERAINYLVYKAAGSRTKYGVNISGQSMQNPKFIKSLLEKLERRSGLAERLIFEITESTPIDDFRVAHHFIQELRKRGFVVCMDDFGPDSGTFKHLKALEVDYIKLDAQYTRRFMTDEKDKEKLIDIQKQCAAKKLPLIAKRIDTKEQRDELLKIGITQGQGFLFSKPGTWPDYDRGKLGFE